MYPPHQSLNLCIPQGTSLVQIYLARRGNFLAIALRMSHKGYFKHYHPSQGSEGNVGSPMPHLTFPTSPLPEGTFPAPELEVPPTKSEGGRQVLGKSSSDEPSTIFLAGTSDGQAGMSVSDTPTEHMSVHKSPQNLKSE